METDVNFICNLDPTIYKVITTSIVTTQVIITDRQLEHIRERHPDISESVIEQLEKIISSPDYIIETDMPSTANILKHLEINGKGYQLILRIKTASDPVEFQNSIITLMSVNEKRYRQYLRNRKILYKRESL
ncbi:MAG: PBECR2 nuclease fold domain-containing protein [Faecalibacterium prausnitzii]|uniref:PBECR2 nuclease fold domain-containing protein n=1 Tax=Faecalibacterium prausnitzii TaxID=853 RepID=UPI00130E09B7|nr:PBECR2 nuclease fold domain-containing protein [Faecalibacterium prausnitzii]